MGLELSDSDRAELEGENGAANALAMRVLTRVAEAMGAARLLDISGAHIDSCLYHGEAGVDFVERLVAGGGRVAVPTTLNVSSLDLLHPDLFRGDPGLARKGRILMQRYEQLGCRPTWTCAPYQLGDRPAFGDHVAWAESNAIVFANSVLGARTHRYGDFIDICCALVGRAPAGGLHLDENRRGEVVFRVEGLSDVLFASDALYPVLGHLVGRRAGVRVPVIVGLPAVSEDRLKALGAAAASSGAVGLFHAVGSTPEAPTLEAALGGESPDETIVVGPGELQIARDELTTATDPRLGAVSVGTPHYSITEFQQLVDLLAGRSVAPGIGFYVNTGREVLNEVGLRGWEDVLTAAGVTIVTDTCTYVTPVMDDFSGSAMTNSAKWAYYAPGNLGLDVVFGSTEDCVESAIAGQVVRDESVWTGG